MATWCFITGWVGLKCNSYEDSEVVEQAALKVVLSLTLEDLKSQAGQAMK